MGVTGGHSTFCGPRETLPVKKMCGTQEGGCNYHTYSSQSQPAGQMEYNPLANPMAQPYDSGETPPPHYSPMRAMESTGHEPPTYLSALGEIIQAMNQGVQEALDHLNRDIREEEGHVTVQYLKEVPPSLDDLIAVHI